MITNNDFKTFQYNILGQQTQVTGDISFSGDAILTASVEGNIKMLNSAKLLLERGSKVKGSIEAFDLEIFGEVEGNITSSGTVSIRSNAQVTGMVKAKKLIIYPGALVNTESHSQGE